QLTVIQQFKIDWGEPFSSILVALEVMAFDMDMISISCVAPMDPVMKFTTRTLLVLVFFAVAAM
ncbi:RPS6, partial [Symbiodinium pilosum]